MIYNQKLVSDFHEAGRDLSILACFGFDRPQGALGPGQWHKPRL
jgi:hypothetical protein